MSEDLAVLFEQYQSNVFEGPRLALAEQLGVTAKSTRRLGIGWDPARGTWVFAERDDRGQVIGLAHRTPEGKKFFGTGGKRGLTYVQDAMYQAGKKTYTPGAHNWVRTSKVEGIVCPKCGHSDWCLVSADNPKDPAACLCQRISEGAKCVAGLGGWVHVLKSSGDIRRPLSVLGDVADRTILVVEGATDVLAGTDLGFFTVGKPSADGGQLLLKKVLQGCTVCVIGENDEHIDHNGKTIWPGKKGLETTMQNLVGVARSVVGIFPPKEIKDLRQWLQAGVTPEQLSNYIEEHGDRSVGDMDVFPDDIAANIAKEFIKRSYTQDDLLTLRYHLGNWIRWRDNCYTTIPREILHGSVYEFLDGKRFKMLGKNGEVTVQPYKPTRSKVMDIVDSMYRWCPIEGYAPRWIDGMEGPDPVDLVSFTNGILDLREYEVGKIVLYDPTPGFFTYMTLPYAFDENADSPWSIQAIKNLCNDEDDTHEQMRQWTGYCIIPDGSMRALMIFQGRPAAGKSTMADVISSIVGYKNRNATTLEALGERFGLSEMINRLITVIGDAQTPDHRRAAMAMEKILLITGGDPVSVDRKFLEQTTYNSLPIRFLIAVNNLPQLPDRGRAVEARLRVSYFGQSFLGKEDWKMRDRLKEEASQGKLINWALGGLMSLRKAKRFTTPKSSIQILDSFRAIATPIIPFLQECGMFCPDDMKADDDRMNKQWWVNKDELYDCWKGWCDDNGRMPGAKESFSQNILSIYPKIHAARRALTGSQRIYVFTGLRLQSWVAATYLRKQR